MLIEPTGVEAHHDATMGRTGPAARAPAGSGRGPALLFAKSIPRRARGAGQDGSGVRASVIFADWISWFQAKRQERKNATSGRGVLMGRRLGVRALVPCGHDQHSEQGRARRRDTVTANGVGRQGMLQASLRITVIMTRSISDRGPDALRWGPRVLDGNRPEVIPGGSADFRVDTWGQPCGHTSIRGTARPNATRAIPPRRGLGPWALGSLSVPLGGLGALSFAQSGARAANPEGSKPD